MRKIYETALQLANEQNSLIIIIDIHYNFKTQMHTGYLALANGHEYTIDLAGWTKIK